MDNVEAGEALLDFLKSRSLPNACGLTLTVKQGIPISSERGVSYKSVNRYDLSLNVRHFLNRLNRKAYGSASNRYGKRLGAIPVVEGNKSIRYHLHMIIERPEFWSRAAFLHHIAESWKKTDFGHNNIHFDGDIDFGWYGYITKTYSKQHGLFDAVDWVNVHMPSAS